MFHEQGNPHTDDSNELCHLYNKEVFPKDTHDSVTKAEMIGKEHFETFYRARILTASIPISSPIKMNKLSLPGTPLKDKRRPLLQKKMSTFLESSTFLFMSEKAMQKSCLSMKTQRFHLRCQKMGSFEKVLSHYLFLASRYQVKNPQLA